MKLLARIRRWWHCSAGTCDPVNCRNAVRTVITCTCGIVWWCSDGAIPVGAVVKPTFKKK